MIFNKYSESDAPTGGQVPGLPVAKRYIKANSAELKLELGMSITKVQAVASYCLQFGEETNLVLKRFYHTQNLSPYPFQKILKFKKGTPSA